MENKKIISMVKRLVSELEDATGFMHTFDDYPEGIGCTCEAEDIESDDCVCIDDDGVCKRVRDKDKLIEEAKKFFGLDDLKIGE